MPDLWRLTYHDPGDTTMERKSTKRKRFTVKALKRSTVRKATAVIATPEYSPHQIQDGFDFDLHELSTDDVQFINRNYQNIYENEFHRQISNTIALHGVKVRRDTFSHSLCCVFDALGLIHHDIIRTRHAIATSRVHTPLLY